MTESLYLIDTSIWIEALRPQGNGAIRQRVNEILTERKAAIIPVVMLELLSGVQDEKGYTEVFEDLSALLQFFPDETVWVKSYRTAFELRRLGLTVPATDLLIAIVAQENQAIVLHADRHFDLIARHIALKVESWVETVSTKRKRKR